MLSLETFAFICLRKLNGMTHFGKDFYNIDVVKSLKCDRGNIMNVTGESTIHDEDAQLELTDSKARLVMHC